MGAGKTTVGQRCAERLDRPFVDTDDLVVDARRHDGRGDLRRRRRAAVPRARARRGRRRVRVARAARDRVRRRSGARSREPARAARRRASSCGCARRAAVLAARVGDGATATAARAATRPARSRGSSGCASRAYEAAAARVVDTDDRDVDAVADAVLDAFEEAASVTRAIRVDLGDAQLRRRRRRRRARRARDRARAAGGASRSSRQAAIADGTSATRRAPRSTAPASRTRRSSWATARTPRRSRPSTSSAARFAQWGLLRGDAVVAVGGGVVGDTAGFAAAVYYRGVDVVQVPTTLLAMVDAAIGGKTGVNLPEGKNLVGAFHQPLAVLADPGVLATLPDREYRCGLGEVAKYALMGDDFVLAATSDALARPRPGRRSPTVIARCAAIKARVRRGRRARAHRARARCSTTATRSRTRSRPRPATRCCTARRSRSASCSRRSSPARSSGSTRRAVAHHEALVGALGLPTQAPAGLRGRRPRRDHGARQEVGRWAHVRARRAERHRAGRRSRPGRGRARRSPRSAWRDEPMATILLLSGPNLNLLGEREPEHYGTTTLDELVARRARDRGRSAATSSSTCSRTTRASSSTRSTARAAAARAIVFNPGAFSHYAYALADALATFDGVKVELHLSNPHAREAWRHHSVISPVVDGTITGLRADRLPPRGRGRRRPCWRTDMT